MTGEAIQGFIQRFEVAPSFCLTLQCEAQLHTIHKISEFLLVDSISGLIKITKNMNRH